VTLLLLLLAQSRMDLTETGIHVLVPARCIACNRTEDFTHDTPSGQVCDRDWKTMTGHTWSTPLGSWQKTGSTTRSPDEPEGAGPKKVAWWKRWFGWLERLLKWN
jgi:hypothetical protein